MKLGNKFELKQLNYSLIHKPTCVSGYNLSKDRTRRKNECSGSLRTSYYVIKNLFVQVVQTSFRVFDASILQYVSHSTISNVPAPIKAQPIRDFAVNSSCRNTNASTSVMITLSLSMGTTLDAWPICSAL